MKLFCLIMATALLSTQLWASVDPNTATDTSAQPAACQLMTASTVPLDSASQPNEASLQGKTAELPKPNAH